MNIAGLGSGQSDLFQVDAYVRHAEGPGHRSGALAYGWQGVATDRIVTISGLDHLRAEFNAHAFSGGVEGGGYRLISPWTGGLGLTLYAAAQFTKLDLPACAEGVLFGSSTFTLSDGATSPTDARTELGLRTGESFAVQNGILTLRGRLAWVHDFNPEPSIASTFQSPPGGGLVVNGAAKGSDSALTTLSSEMTWKNGGSMGVTFAGEFSGVSRFHAGMGTVRCTW